MSLQPLPSCFVPEVRSTYIAFASKLSGRVNLPLRWTSYTLVTLGLKAGFASMTSNEGKLFASNAVSGLNLARLAGAAKAVRSNAILARQTFAF